MSEVKCKIENERLTDDEVLMKHLDDHKQIEHEGNPASWYYAGFASLLWNIFHI
jgi:hypothetical protein